MSADGHGFSQNSSLDPFSYFRSRNIKEKQSRQTRLTHTGIVRQKFLFCIPFALCKDLSKKINISSFFPPLLRMTRLFAFVYQPSMYFLILVIARGSETICKCYCFFISGQQRLVTVNIDFYSFRHRLSIFNR